MQVYGFIQAACHSAFLATSTRMLTIEHLQARDHQRAFPITYIVIMYAQVLNEEAITQQQRADVAAMFQPLEDVVAASFDADLQASHLAVDHSCCLMNPFLP